ADVAGFEVTMNDAAQVSGVHSFTNLDENIERPRLDNLAIRIVGADIDHCLVERLTVYVVHHEVLKAGDDARIVHRHDIRMVEAAQRFDFALEPAAVRERREWTLPHDFDRHIALGAPLNRVVDNALPPAANFANDLITGNLNFGLGRRWRGRWKRPIHR